MTGLKRRASLPGAYPSILFHRINCMRRFAITAAIAALLLVPAPTHARIIRLVIMQTESPTFEGLRFGTVGLYEWLIGYALGELDPRDPRNAGIINLDKAPRNARGMVEYRIDVRILKPVDMARANGRIFYDAVNRGGQRSLGSRVNGGSNSALPRLAADAGSRFLMERGYTMVWSGWQGDLEPNETGLRAVLPVARNADGTPIVGMHREEFIFGNTTNPITLEGPPVRTNGVGSLSYPAADMDPSKATLRVRQYSVDAWQTPADMSWSYVSPTQIRINRPDGFDADAIYEFIYPAKDPIVMGIGFAAIRDINSYLRYAPNSADAVNPLAGRIQKVMAMGISQSGRLLPDFVHQGFNEDERGRMVFDGIMPIVAGSRKTEVNRQFSIAGDVSFQHEDNLSPMHQFPFTYGVIRDPLSGRTDGFLAGCIAAGNCPKFIQIDTDTEIHQAAASLLVTDATGAPVSLPDNVRWYVMAGSSHTGGSDRFPRFSEIRPAGDCQQNGNVLNYSVHVRALIAALDEWITNGTAPPDDRHPSVTNGTLVPPNHPRAGFPSIPGFRYSGLVNVPRLRDYNAFPVKEGQAYQVFVIAKDSDGNNAAGVRHPFLEAPLGTHTGWNSRKAGFAENALCENTGSFIPFMSTKAERLATRDQRLSIEERYPTHAAYVDKVAAAVERLMQARLLLPADGKLIVTLAEASDVGKTSAPADTRTPARQ
jgi:hypothetical protein